ncbi:MAG: AI-2E family transporter [Parvularculales bacterium]
MDNFAIRQFLALSWFIVLVIGGSLLFFGSDILIPFAMAIMIWYLINALANGITRLPLLPHRPPFWFGLTIALCLMGVLLYLAGQLITTNVSLVYQAAPLYGQRLAALAERLNNSMGLGALGDVFNITKLARDIDVVPWLQRLANALTDIASLTGIILIYIFFLLVEQKNFSAKMEALFPDLQRRQNIVETFDSVQHHIQAYIWIKTLMSVMVGGISWIILATVGVDYAAFWGVLIFLLNYIPIIGSLLGVVFPALLAVVQFDSFTPFLIVIAGCGISQFVIGNILEPRLMGGKLNVSPVVVVLSLALWGSLWGIAGMFLSMPITVIIIIVLSRFSATRPIAIFLSADGKINTPSS